MTVPKQQLQEWLKPRRTSTSKSQGGESQLSFRQTRQILASSQTEGGDSIILGVTDKPPRRVVDCRRSRNWSDQGRADRQAESSASKPERSLIQMAVCWSSPRLAAQIGMPVAVEGAYSMRAGEDLAPMIAGHAKAHLRGGRPRLLRRICRRPRLPIWTRRRGVATQPWARHLRRQGSGEAISG